MTGLALGAALALAGAAWLGVPPDPARLPLGVAFPTVGRVAPRTLAAWLGAGRAVALRDVRSRDEHRVSHLPGSIRVDPGARALPVTPPDAEVVVVYCAVGFRSSALVARLPPSGDGPPVLDLRGGVFAWANAGLPLVDGAGRPTRRVHPYDRFWGLFLRAPASTPDA